MATSNWISRLAVLAGIAVAGIWDEIVFAAAPIYLTTRWGGLPAFLVLAPAYAIFGTAVSIALFGRVRGRYVRPTRAQAFVSRWAATTEDSRIRRRLVAGGFVGFVLASWLLGGILTAFILHNLGLRRNRAILFATANAIWAVTFVGQYTGLTAVVLALL